MAQTFTCSLVTPQQQLLDEQVTYASVPAWDGLVGLEPGRAPIVFRLSSGALRLDLVGGDSRWFFVGGGFAQMKDNQLTLLADQAVPSDEIDTKDANQAMQQAMAQSASGDEAITLRQQEVDRARSMASLAQHTKP